MAGNLESDIDRLYQLPLKEFTTARNQLAKDLAGEAKRRVQQLSKPSVAAWAANQLYWQDRPTYDALIAAAERLRSAHRAVISGRTADLRKPDADHRSAVDEAMRAAIGMLKQAGFDPSAATIDELKRTLGALPADIPAGRLTRALEPAGFGLLAGLQGLKPAARLKALNVEKPAPAPRAAAQASQTSQAAQARLAARKAREERVAAERERQRLQARARKAERFVLAVKKKLKAARAAEDKLGAALAVAKAARERLEHELERRQFDARNAAVGSISSG